MEDLKNKLFEILLQVKTQLGGGNAVPENTKKLIQQTLKKHHDGVGIYNTHSDEYEFIFWYQDGAVPFNNPTIARSQLEENIHPFDRQYILSGKLQAAQRIKKAASTEWLDFVLMFECRVKDKHGNYRRMHLQYKVLELDQNNKISLILLLMNDVGEINSNSCARGMTLVNCNSGKRIRLDKKTSLSNTEIKVIGLLAKGCNSEQVAQKLIISVKTVEAHRTNIRQKLDAINVGHATNYARLIMVCCGES